MLNLIPKVKKLDIKNGFLKKNAVFYENINCDERVVLALSKLPFEKNGAELIITLVGGCGEGYEITIDEATVNITANTPIGAFYAVQTLRQIFKHKQIPCLYIKDEPDFKYRGFYHDVTRGRVPTVETIKSIIDNMAYYKLNSLQLYIEHTFEFKECKDILDKFGYLTAEEIKEIGAYCKQNFIDFIPSIATFGHLFEILQQEKYKHLRLAQECDNPNFWTLRAHHHTINPLLDESFEFIKSLIDQYLPLFESEYFNICCDETFDLKELEGENIDVAKIYVDFVRKIIDHVTQKGKKVMMWADILLQHPETIDMLPNDVCFLNWEYSSKAQETKVMKFSELKKQQIVCPSTRSWARLCEDVEGEEKNISLMTEYGYKHGAVGVLNTNWGDWGHPCPIELSAYGLVLGAAKSWSVNTEIDDKFYDAINFLLFEHEDAIQILNKVSKMHDGALWYDFCRNYFIKRYSAEENYTDYKFEDMLNMQKMYLEVADCLKSQKWGKDEYRQAILLCAEAFCVMNELSQKLKGVQFERVTDTYSWIEKYKQNWLSKNKQSELNSVIEIFKFCEEK